MTETGATCGFYGNESENYYVTPKGAVYAWGSGDFDGVRAIESLPSGVASTAGLMAPDECVEILRQIEAESGEVLVADAV